MKSLKNLLIGLIILSLGVILGLNALEITNIDIFFDGWWTLFIIIPSVIGLLTDNDKTGNIIGLLIGVGLLLGCQGIITFGLILKLIFPVILIIIGLSYIFKDMFNKKITNKMKKIDNKDLKEYCSTFSSQKINFDDQEFNGCSLTAVFGSIECDLRKMKIEKDQVINVSAIFGGVDILVDESVNVKVVSTCIFGSVDNKSKSNNDVPTIYVNASCVFGGVDIK